MKIPLLLLAVASALIYNATCQAQTTLRIDIGEIQADQWRAQNLQLQVQRDQGQLQIEKLQHPRLPAAARIQLHCAQIQWQPLRCADAQARATLEQLAEINTTFSARWQTPAHWQLSLAQLHATATYNSDDGRIASDRLQLSGSAELRHQAGQTTLALALSAAQGQAYREPFFLDLAAHPLHLDVQLNLPDDAPLQLHLLHAQQIGVGTLTLRGEIDPHAWRAPPWLHLHANIEDARAASTLYLQPLLATHALQNTALSGAVQMQLDWRDGAPVAFSSHLQDVGVDIPRWHSTVENLEGELNWHANDAARAQSQLQWRRGQIGRIPIAASTLRLSARARDITVQTPATLPLLDGGVRIQTLAIQNLGTPHMAAQFAARIIPISLSQLCQALGWPVFSGTLAGDLPGLRYQQRRLDLEGALHAAVFDGDIRISNLQILDPLGALPRIRTDLQLRQLDLTAVTSAFNFGRISGRLDGDVNGLRLLGWQPVAMDAHVYSTPGDRSRKRISQRAIDSISAVGGGPTGVLSRGFLRFFDAFAYRRIEWRCVLNNNICTMSGTHAPATDGGYTLVQGQGVPRIDIIGHNPQINWPLLMAQLKAALNSPTVEVR